MGDTLSFTVYRVPLTVNGKRLTVNGKRNVFKERAVKWAM